MADTRKVFLLDIDGVLNEPQQPVAQDMKMFLESLARRHRVYFVTGNSFVKSIDILGLDFRSPGFGGIFCNNADELRSVTGRLIWRDEVTPPLPQITVSMERAPMNRCNNSIEWRSPRFVNVSEVGRYASKEERSVASSAWMDDFIFYLKHDLGDEFCSIEIAKGGKVSLDIYSKGADKSRAGQWLVDHGYQFTFIGDKTAPGGNDYPLIKFCETTLNVGLTTTGPAHTMELIERANEQI